MTDQPQDRKRKKRPAATFSQGWRPPLVFSFEDMIRESNRIENIERDPTSEEMSEFLRFLNLERLNVSELKYFVSIYQPGAVLRDKPGLNVRVGTHYPPSGGPQIEEKLASLLDAVNRTTVYSWEAHTLFEWLHPFTDGNGRSGRMIWYWFQHRIASHMMTYGFLRGYYYQTLQNGNTKHLRERLGWGK